MRSCLNFHRFYQSNWGLGGSFHRVCLLVFIWNGSSDSKLVRKWSSRLSDGGPNQSVDDVWYRQWCQQVLDTVPNTLFYIHILSKLKATPLWFEIYLLRASTRILDEKSSWIDNIHNGEHILPQICYFLWYLGREYHTIERWLKYRSWPTKYYIWTNVSDPTMVCCM